MKHIIKLIKDNNLEDNVLIWAGSFRYLNSSFPNGFSFNAWHSLNSQLDLGLAKTIVRLLMEESLINLIEHEKYVIDDDKKLQQFLEYLSTIVKFDFSFLNDQSRLLWTVPVNQQTTIPLEIRSNYEYLYTYIQNLLLSTNERIILIAPYFTMAGLKSLYTSIEAINNAKQNITIDFVVNDLENESNKKAFSYFMKLFKAKNNNKVNVYEPIEKKDSSLWFHAKLMLVDNNKGYMGSANYSVSALSNQFEIGIPLDINQANAITQLIDYWIRERVFIKKMFVQ